LEEQSEAKGISPNFSKSMVKQNEASFFFVKKAKKNEYNRSSTIEGMPLLMAKL
jgi:hypothetical protein